MHCGICEIDEIILVLVAFTEKKSPRIDGHIGFNELLRIMSFDPMTIINMHLWYMYGGFQLCFSLWKLY